MNYPDHLCKLLHIDMPVVQAPMLGVSTPEMTAAAANTGALGSLALGGLSAAKSKELISATKKLTSKHFAVNLFVYDYPQQTNAGQFEEMNRFLGQLSNDYNIPYTSKNISEIPFYSYKDLIPVLLEEKTDVVSFTFGILTDEEIQLLHSNNIILIGTATSAAEVKLLSDKNIDVICLQGIEAGGHRGSFLQTEPVPQVRLNDLLIAAKEITDKLLIAAGGIYDKASAQKAFDLGAAAVQVGSILIAASESAAIESYKELAMQSKPEDSVLILSFSGRQAKGIANTFTKAVDASGLAVPPYPLQNVLTNSIRDWARIHNDARFLSLWAGENARFTKRASTEQILKQLLEI
ncbi:NAD(P)H-dependent flavin oxidoreductase [Chitinophagaceae bacterium MMS25-I14]